MLSSFGVIRDHVHLHLSWIESLSSLLQERFWGIAQIPAEFLVLRICKKYHINKDEYDSLILIDTNTGEIEYQVLDYKPPNFIVSDINSNNRKTIQCDSVDNLCKDYPEFCV